MHFVFDDLMTVDLVSLDAFCGITTNGDIG